MRNIRHLGHNIRDATGHYVTSAAVLGFLLVSANEVRERYMTSPDPMGYSSAREVLAKSLPSLVQRLGVESRVMSLVKTMALADMAKRPTDYLAIADGLKEVLGESPTKAASKVSCLPAEEREPFSRDLNKFGLALFKLAQRLDELIPATPLYEAGGTKLGKFASQLLDLGKAVKDNNAREVFACCRGFYMKTCSRDSH